MVIVVAECLLARDLTAVPCLFAAAFCLCVTLFIEELPWLRGRDLELVMGEAVCNWLGWPLPARAES